MIKLEQLDVKLPVRDIFARKIFDCRGNPTVETEALAGENIVGRVSVPSGLISAGLAAAETAVKSPEKMSGLADRVIENINTHIVQELIGKNVFDQEEIDSTRALWEQRLYSAYQPQQPVQQRLRSDFPCTAILAVFRQKAFPCPPYR